MRAWKKPSFFSSIIQLKKPMFQFSKTAKKKQKFISIPEPIKKFAKLAVCKFGSEDFNLIKN